MKLLSKNNAKLLKGESFGWLTLGLSLAPFNLSGKNLCPHASAGCAAACGYGQGGDRVVGLRVGKEEEIEGLDYGEHGNEAYHGFVMVRTE